MAHGPGWRDSVPLRFCEWQEERQNTSNFSLSWKLEKFNRFVNFCSREVQRKERANDTAGHRGRVLRAPMLGEPAALKCSILGDAAFRS